MKRPSFKWVKTRQTKYGAYLFTYILIVAGLITLVNWWVNRNSKSWDLTTNKRYSLSEYTRKTVRGLQQDVKVYYFDRQNQFGRAKDLLDQYDALSGRFSVEYVDPDRKPLIARSLGVKTYGTIFLTVGERRQEANVLDEESVTNALVRLVKTGKKAICFVQDFGEYDIENSDRQGYSRAKKALEDSTYEVKSISLLREAKVPADCTVVVVAGPKNEYVDPVVQAIRTFVEGGGEALFLVDPGAGQKLAELLANWNIQLKDDLVVDLNPLNQLFGADVTMPIITQYKSHAITRELNRVATLLPFARSVQAGKDSKAGISVEPLFETSEASWSTKFDAAKKTVELKRESDPKGPIPLAVAATVKKEGDKPAGEGEKKEGRVVVVGSSRFPANSYISFNGNRDLFVNTVNWLASDEDLISIRPKEQENRRVNLSTGQMRRVFYASVLGLPLLMIIGGVAVWWKRR